VTGAGNQKEDTDGKADSDGEPSTSGENPGPSASGILI